MQKLTSLRLGSLVSARLLKSGAILILLAGLTVDALRAQDSFASAQVLPGDVWGSVANDNTGVVPDIGTPSTAGYAPNAPLWYQWTAPQDGVVDIDTVGSANYLVTNTIPIGFDPNTFETIYFTNVANINLDTVLAVYTGSSLTTLSQIAANDDLFPINSSNPQYNESRSSLGLGLTEYPQPYYGPSHLRFNARSGQTYYFVEDTKSGTGPLQLSWAYKSSGVFRFATEDQDTYTGLPMYQASDTESLPPSGGVEANTTRVTYYNYNAPGVLVTVTRSAGFTGRAVIHYATVDGTDLPEIPPGDVPAFGEGVSFLNGTNLAIISSAFTPVSGTLVFDDFEMSKTILIPVTQAFATIPGYDQLNKDFGIKLFTDGTNGPALDGFESSDVSQPRVDPVFNLAMVRLLSTTGDPHGLNYVDEVVTNAPVGTNDPVVVTNQVVATFPTNVVFNFEKANYRVPADVNDTNVSPYTRVTVYVERTGTNNAATTLHYRVNNFLGSDTDASEEDNNVFPLQPGSDYAVPTPASAGAIRGVNPDFDMVQGTISFPDKGPGYASQPISFTVPTSKLTKFNKDFTIQIYEIVNDAPVLVGNVNQTTVTILFNDQNPPAGSVDEFYNADFNSQLALYAGQVPITVPPDNPNPGVGIYGQVYSLALLTNNETLLGGDFASYNGLARNNVALVLTNGNLDTTFNPGTGANGAVNAASYFGNQFYIGGDFTSYNGALVGHVARLNANGSLDTSFNPGLGADGAVRALTVLPNGEVLIAGDFTHVNGVARNYLALLNTDGTLDTSFDPANNLDGPVYALVQQQGGQGELLIVAGGNFDVSGQIYKNIVRLNSDGSIDGTFNPGTGANGLVRTFTRMPGGRMVVGGEFTQINGVSLNHIARLNSDGSIDSGFNIGSGADDAVFNVNYVTVSNIVDTTTVIVTNTDGTITTNTDTIYALNHYLYVGGTFSSFNGTHRYGFTRLYLDGTVDTTFMDTAYNQFAGLKRIYSYDHPGVFASAVQSDGNVLIGGSFAQVGGGQANTNVCNTLDSEQFIAPSFGDTNLWVEPKARDGVRNRSGFARLIGGATPGPGNISLNQNSYSANKSQTALTVSLVRTNGNLGPAAANFSVQPGLAQSGLDYTYNSSSPLFWVAWNYISNPTRVRSDGLSGQSGFLADPYGLNLTLSQADSLLNNQSKVTVSIIPNKSTPGNLSAQFQLDSPSVADTFYLGGQNIPLGTALGASSAPFTLVDDTSFPGQFGFSSPVFIATNLSPIISVVRSNSVFGVVSMLYSSSNGTAVVGTDYVGITNKSLIFGAGVASNGFNVTLKDNGVIYTNMVEKTVNLRLFNLGSITPGATFGISNAVLRIINPNYRGYVTLSDSNYNGAISSGVLNFTVNRVSGSQGSVTVQYATTNGSAINGVDYVGATNTLTWNAGDVSPKVVSIPLINPGVVGPNKQFGVTLFNPTLNGASTPSLMGLLTNATLTISNDNNNGTIQFSAPSYLVNEAGGYATITVVRTGGAVGPISAHYSTSNGTALDGVNYSSVNGTVALESGQTSGSFTIPILNDGVTDPSPANFYFNVSLTGPGINGSAVVQIVDAQTYNQPPGSPDTAFNAAGMNGDVLSLALQSNGQILAGGNFTAVGPVAKSRLARLNADGSLDTAFLNGLSGANAAVNAIVSQTDGRILVGGAFTTIDDIHRNFIARLMSDGSLDTSFNPGSGADNTVNALATTFLGGARKIYVGGAFGAFNGVSSSGLIRLNNDGTVDSGFNIGSGADGQIYTIATYPTNSVYAGKVLVGGLFANFNGTPANNLVRLNADGSLDTNFNAGFGSGPDGAVHSLAIQAGGQVLVGGSFTNLNTTAVNYIARLNPDGTIDTGFLAAAGLGANGVVEGIAVQPDNRIVLVGQFSRANGLTRNHITRLLPSGAPDPTINFGLGANGDVDAVVVQPTDGMLVIGGAFSQYNGLPNAGIARIYGGSMTGSGAFTFTSGNYRVNENGLVAPITILRSGGTSGTNADFSGDIHVNFATVSGGSAVDGVNYLSLATNVDFPAGEVIKTVLVPVLDDGVVTPDLSVYLALSNPTPPATNGVQTTATLTIVNSDSSVAFSSAFYTQAKNNPTGVAVIDVLRTGGTNTPATVDFYTTTNGTAVIGTDYYPTNSTITFNPGQADVQVQVPIINNSIAQGNKTVALVLSNAVNTTMIAPSNAVLTIIDTVAAPGQLYFSATNFVANEGDGTGYLTVLRTNGSSGSVSASVTVVPGTAQPGVNYGTPNGTVTFGNGETMKKIAVPLVDNNIVQGPVSLSLFLSAPTGGATLTDPTNASLTILDNDSGFAFLNATNYVRETNGFVPIFVQRIGSTNAGIHVDYTTVGGTAVAGVNFTPVSGTLTFGAGESLKNVSLPLIRDPRVTGDLNLTMKLSNPSAGSTLGTPTNTLIVVQDADAGFSFTNSAISVFKNTTNAIITVICSNPSIEPPVGDTNFTPLSVGFATADGTAVAGVDYQATNGTILFTNGIGTNTIAVPILNNSQVLGNHDFTVRLLNPTAPGQLVVPSVQTVTIVDNNSGLSFSSPVYNVLKTGVAATITVLRTDFTNTTSTVKFTTADGTAVAGLDYIATNGVLTFTNGETVKSFNVPVIANTTVQPDKTVLVQLFNPTNAFLIAPYAATITIHDTTGSLVVPAGSTFAAGGDPNGNGLIDPNENVSLLFALRASGGTNIPNVYATLLVTNGITSPSPSGAVSYGPLTVGGHAVSRQFSFRANGTNSQQIAATFRLNNGVTNIGTAIFTYTLGSWTMTFTNTNSIIINDLAIASPYPSSITVSNAGGVIIKSVVTLTNLYHGFTKDIEALVVSPAGQDTLLMGHAGNGSVSKITLTFDDAATNSLSNTSILTTGTNKPTAYPSTTVFP